MPRIRLFAGAREAAGVGADEIDGTTVGDVLDNAVARYGADFAGLLDTCRIWIDGEPAERSDHVPTEAEVAVLPPVSGGSVGAEASGSPDARYDRPFPRAGHPCHPTTGEVR